MPTSRPNARSSSAICSYWDARSAKSKAQVRLPGRKVAAHVGTTGQQAMGDQGCPCSDCKPLDRAIRTGVRPKMPPRRAVHAVSRCRTPSAPCCNLGAPRARSTPPLPNAGCVAQPGMLGPPGSPAQHCRPLGRLVTSCSTVGKQARCMVHSQLVGAGTPLRWAANALAHRPGSLARVSALPPWRPHR